MSSFIENEKKARRAAIWIIGATYEAVRKYKNIYRFRGYLGKLSFWLLFIGLVGIMGSFAYGGTKEIFVYRILALDWWANQVRPAMANARVLLGFSALVFIAEAIILIYDLFTMKNREISEEEQFARNNKLGSSSRISMWRKTCCRLNLESGWEESGFLAWW
jgi:nitric oxide reductase subunit B